MNSITSIVRGRGVPSLAMAVMGLLALSLPPAAHALAGGSVSIDVFCYPERLPLVVDGIVYVGGQGTLRFTWHAGTTHTIGVLEPVYYTGPGERLVFSGWNTGEKSQTITLTAEENMSLVALYTREAYLSISSKYGHTRGEGWYPLGSTASVWAPRIVELGPGLRAVFTGWSQGSSPYEENNTLVILGPTSLTASWRLEAYLNATTSIGAPLLGGGWTSLGEARLTAPGRVEAGDGVRYVFSHWEARDGPATIEGDPSEPSVTVRLEGPASVVAVYDTYYRVTVNLGPLGESEEYVREGTLYEASAGRTIVNTGPGERLALYSWSTGAHSATTTINVTGPTSVYTVWRPQYKVTVEAGEAPVEGSGWYWAGSNITLAAPSTYPERAGARLVFSHWEGDASGPDPVLHLRVDGPITVKPVYTRSYRGTVAGVLIAGLAAAGTVLALSRARRALARALAGAAGKGVQD